MTIEWTGFALTRIFPRSPPNRKPRSLRSGRSKSWSRANSVGRYSSSSENSISYCVRLRTRTFEETNELRKTRARLCSFETIVFDVRLIERLPDESLRMSISYPNVSWYRILFYPRTPPFTRPFVTPCIHHIYYISMSYYSNNDQQRITVKRMLYVIPAGFPPAWFRHAVYVYAYVYNRITLATT